MTKKRITFWVESTGMHRKEKTINKPTGWDKLPEAKRKEVAEEYAARMYGEMFYNSEYMICFGYYAQQETPK